MSAKIARRRGRVRGSTKNATGRGAYEFFYSVDCPTESIPEVLLLPLGVHSSDVPQLIVKFGKIWDRCGGNLEKTVRAAREVAICS